MATLLVSGSAPPIPSIWRMSGEPITASRMRSRSSVSAGRSLAKKKGPFEVPPRINVQGIGVCEDVMRLSLSEVLEAELRDFLAQVVDIESEFPTCKSFSGRILLANPLFRGCSDFLCGRTLYDHDSIIIGDDHIASFDGRTCAHDRQVH